MIRLWKWLLNLYKPKRWFVGIDRAKTNGDYSARIKGYISDDRLIVTNIETWKD